MNIKSIIFWGILVAVAVGRFYFTFSIENKISNNPCVGQNISGTGKISNEPEVKETGQVFVVDAILVNRVNEIDNESSNLPPEKCLENVRIRAKTKIFPEYSYGDEISFSGKLSKPFNFRSENGREFNYEGFLAKNDIYFEIKSAKIDLVTENNNVGYASVTGFLKKIKKSLFSLKGKFVSNLNNVLGEPHSALASGLVVGEKSALGKDLLEDFRIVGLIHIIVLSGFNITIIGEALRRVLSFLPRIWGIFIGGIAIVLFGVMVGGGATVVRSCFMAVIALSADLIRRDYSVMRALIFAGLLMLSLNPKILLYDPSFQLSFLATLGLILLASPLEKKLLFIPEKFGIRGIVASTLATQIFVSPFILHMMGQISIIGMVVNILVLPFIPITMLSVFLAGSLSIVWQPLSVFFGWTSHWLLSYELLMVEQFAKVPYASLDIPPFSFWWVVGFYTAFVVLYFIFYRRPI